MIKMKNFHSKLIDARSNKLFIFAFTMKFEKLKERKMQKLEEIIKL